jgi:hypothetical protein
MIKKRAWRYKCEFCGKTGSSASHMTRHERGCTKNPNRLCGVCHQKWDDDHKEILIKALGDGRSKEVVDDLREAAEGCHACMMAAVRLSGLQTPPDEEGPGFSIEHFNYKEEKDRYWHDRNQENARSYYGMD